MLLLDFVTRRLTCRIDAAGGTRLSRHLSIGLASSMQQYLLRGWEFSSGDLTARQFHGFYLRTILLALWLLAAVLEAYCFWRRLRGVGLNR